MALDISLDLNRTGSPAQYWRITSAHIDHCAAAVTVWLQGWRDAATRQSGMAALGALQLVLAATDLVTSDLHSATTSALYQALKRKAAQEASQAALVVPAIKAFSAGVLANAEDC